MGLFKRFSVTFEFQRPSVAGTRHFDTNGTPAQSPKSFTSTRDFNHPSLRHRTSTIRHFDTELRSSVTSTRIFVDVTNCWKDVSKWRMIEVTCRSHGWLKWRVEVKNFGTWVGVAFFSNHGYSPGAEILQNICFNYKKITVWLFINLCTKDSSLPEQFL